MRLKINILSNGLHENVSRYYYHFLFDRKKYTFLTIPNK